MAGEIDIDEIRNAIRVARQKMLDDNSRHVPVSDLLVDRWETAQFYGFGEGTTCYSSALIIGRVTVGRNSWIGPNVVLDGSGGLEIGDYVSISAGVQIYSHDSVNWSTTLGQWDVEREATSIGNGVYIGPNAIIEKGVAIGNRSIIGAMTLVNQDVPSGYKCFGTPCRLIPC